MAASKTAYEIRADLLVLAKQIAHDNSIEDGKHGTYTVDEVLRVAKELNKFVSEQHSKPQ